MIFFAQDDRHVLDAPISTLSSVRFSRPAPYFTCASFVNRFRGKRVLSKSAIIFLR
jgi:hypothetical protein